MLATQMLMMEGVAAYNRLMFNTSQIPDSHSYVDFNLPTPPTQEELNSNCKSNSFSYFNQSARGGTINGGVQKLKRYKCSQPKVQQHSTKDKLKTHSSDINIDSSGQRRSKGVSRLAMSVVPLHINDSMQRFNGSANLTVPFPRPISASRRGHPGPSMLMMSSDGGCLRGLPPLSRPPLPPLRFDYHHHSQQLLPHHSPHHHPLGAYPAARIMRHPPHPSRPAQMLPLGVGRIGPPQRLGGPVMAFMGRGGVRMAPRLPIPPPPQIAVGGRTPLSVSSSGPQLPPPPAPPLVPFMNGVATGPTQIMKKVTKGKSTIKTLKTLMNQYPIDKPWVTESIRNEYNKKMDLEERLKGNKDDNLFAQFKVQRDKFVSIYELARDEYLKQEANAIKAKVI